MMRQLSHSFCAGLVAGVLIGAPGCVSAPVSEAWQETVAKNYARQKFGLKKVRVQSITDNGEYFSVWLWQIPEYAGAFVVIEISKEGKVIGWQPGR
jgi:hypothetical protein